MTSVGSGEALEILPGLEIRQAPTRSSKLGHPILLENCELIDEATMAALLPFIGLVQQLRRHLLDPLSTTMDWMVVVAMIVHLHAPAEERLYPVTPTKEDARRLVRDEFPVIVLHNTKHGVGEDGSWGQVDTLHPRIMHLWGPLALACGDMSPGQTVTSSHVHALAVVTVLHELMHTVTHRLCTAALTPTSTAQLAGRRRAERRLGEALELQLLGGLIGMTWGKEPWELSTALAMTASVPSGASLQKVLLSQAWCDGFLAALDSSSLPRVSSSEHTPWKDPKGAICSRINQDLTDDDIITALAPLSPEEEEMLAEARTRCTVIVG